MRQLEEPATASEIKDAADKFGMSKHILPEKSVLKSFRNTLYGM